MINSEQLRQLYLDFFKSKGHAVIPTASLIPENDPTVLFTTAGMHPLVPYLLGEKHPSGTRLTDVQICVRTGDIDEVGDESHCTFFEMLGNWSLGDYFKKESIAWSYEFLTKVLNIDVSKLNVSVFAGDESCPRDEESANIWRSLGLKDEQIFYLPKENNWWGPAGVTGPCGPDTEIFYWRSDEKIPEDFDPENENWVEIWNNVFMQYNHEENDTFTPLKNKNVDTGLGVERVTAVLEGVTDNYKSSVWADVIKKIEEVSNKSYNDEENIKPMRIIADHIRAIVMILGDDAGVKPSNTDQGYVLRRLIRRMIRYAKKINIDINSNWEQDLAILIINKYSKYYKELERNKEIVLESLKNEKIKFNRTLEKGLREFEKVSSKDIDGLTAFHLFDTYGFPIELTEELATERNLKVDIDGFKENFKAHQELSRTASSGQFKGGLGGHSEKETQYHTATHLLNAALKQVVDKNVHQKGSNITEERMRFDFSCDHKLTDEEKQKTEDLVNKWISEGIDVTVEEMPKQQAIDSGAECMFIEKYPDVVTVYSIGDFSKELCGGPHVKNTNELGHFKIVKEEASSAGVRRIKAILE